MTMRIYSVVGARPQFVKAAVVSRALAEAGIAERLIHTGQHYDTRMNEVFFEELDIPAPAVNLAVGSGSHAVQTGETMIRLANYLLSLPRPDWVLVYGDTNSTLAAALVAAKLHWPLAHVEAGLRSFNRKMPEEVNRVLTDRLAALLFCPTETARENLHREGIVEGVRLTGDVMLDATRHFAGRAAAHAPLDTIIPYPPGSYYLATVHRAENTDDPARLDAIVAGLGALGKPVVMPLHPRTRHRLAGRSLPEAVRVMAPVGYLAMLTLVQHAACVLTDSGGLQKEAVWLHTPCITLREETEWIETCAGGWNKLVGADAAAMVAAVRDLPEGPAPCFGQGTAGRASDVIARCLQEPVS